MLNFVKKITLLTILMFTFNMAFAEVGFVNVMMRGTQNCSNKIKQINFEGEKTDIVIITLFDESGKVILKVNTLLNSNNFSYDVPCGFYRLTITSVKKGTFKSYPIQLL